MDCIPILMVKNEATYIRQVLRPLADVFPLVLLGDTGSTDGTAELAEAFANVSVTRFGEMTPRQLGQVRKWLCDQARALGYAWALQVDGDELWSQAALRLMQAQEMPAGKRLGFTTMVSVDWHAGALWEMADQFNRLVVFPTEDEWSGDYPFEWPMSWKAMSEGADIGHYFPLPEGWRHHGLHLHRLDRSPLDAEVYRRVEKQKQFSMRTVDIPFTHPLEERWLSLLRWP